MSFVISPTVYKSAILDRISELYRNDLGLILYGKGSDAGLFVYQDNKFSSNYYTMSETIGDFIIVDNKIYNKKHYKVNDFYCYSTSDDRNWLYYNSTIGTFGSYVLTAKSPVEILYEYRKKDNTWAGDEFWSGSMPYSVDGTSVFTPRGALRNDPSNTKTLTMKYPRWINSTYGEILGEYKGVNGATGSKFVGNEYYESTNWLYKFTKSSIKDSTGHFTYTQSNKKEPIYWSNYKWIFGTYGDSNGWYEGEEPNKNSQVVFKFIKGSSGGIKSDFTLKFKKYVLGNETEKVYIGEVSRWL